MTSRILTEPDFGELPTRVSIRSAFAGQLDAAKAALTTRPGDWALIAEFDSYYTGRNTASYINVGRLGFGPKGHFQAVSRKQPSGTVKVYCRYVGKEPAEASGMAVDGGFTKELPARPVMRAKSAAFATCQCTHTQRRHAEDDGICLAAACDCSAFDGAA